jgi:hypothetical protein
MTSSASGVSVAFSGLGVAVGSGESVGVARRAGDGSSEGAAGVFGASDAGTSIDAGASTGAVGAWEAWALPDGSGEGDPAPTAPTTARTITLASMRAVRMAPLRIIGHSV